MPFRCCRCAADTMRDVAAMLLRAEPDVMPMLLPPARLPLPMF